MKRYETISEAMATPQGAALYKAFSENFDRYWAMSPTVKALADRVPCVLGSRTHLETLVFETLNTLSELES